MVRFLRLRRRGFTLMFFVLVVAAMPLTAFAQTATPDPSSVPQVISAASGVITSFNLTPYITVAAVVGVSAYLYRRFIRASR